MKKFILNLFILIPFVGLCQNPLKLWYQQLAKTWTEALPVGNGRLGAMVFGKENEELIQLNESTLWSGGPVTDNVNPDAPKYLPEIRQAIFEGDYKKASELSKKMQGVYSESYMPSNPVGDVGGGDPKWANWAMGENWLCWHLWEHYLFTGDKKFLKDTAYPLMKGAVSFTLGWLIPDKEGFLVTAPSGSTENSFIEKKETRDQ